MSTPIGACLTRCGGDAGLPFQLQAPRAAGRVPGRRAASALFLFSADPARARWQVRKHPVLQGKCLGGAPPVVSQNV